jgi:triphosphatase
LTLGAWLCTQAQPGAPQAETPSEPSLLGHATATLRNRHKQLRKRGEHLVTLAPPERHAVRIAAKKLRYAAEFFSPLFVRKRTRSYVGALSQLQDVLGTLNDAATTVGLLHEIPAADDAVWRQQAKGIVHGWVEGASHVRMQALAQAWERFLEQKPFWK